MENSKNKVITRAEKYIAKIEGHGSLAVDWSSGNVKLNVHEGERLFEGILVGRTPEEMHWITPRICGVCPVAHNLASLSALEDALEISVNRTTQLLRRLMQIGQNAQSHILHAVFLALPDYVGIDRITQLNKKDPKKFALALDLKELGDEIARVVAGRNVHPTTTTIGGFHKTPSEYALKELLKKIEENIPKAKLLAQFFSRLDYPKLEVDLELLAQKNGEVLSNKRGSFKIKDYKKNIDEQVKNYSTAKFGSYKGSAYMVGALARLYHKFKSSLTSDIGTSLTSDVFPNLNFKNPFHNNLAQVIEILLELKEAVKIIEDIMAERIDGSIAKPPKNPSLKDLSAGGRGIGAIEAPRGGLYNEVHLGGDGMIKYANIITPTVQNLTSMEETAEALLKQHSEKSRKELERLLNMLIRAYDPCITCSVH